MSSRWYWWRTVQRWWHYRFAIACICWDYCFLVPTLLRGNADEVMARDVLERRNNSLARTGGALMFWVDTATGRHSHAGAWERGNQVSIDIANVSLALVKLKLATINKTNQSRRSEFINLGRVECELSTRCGSWRYRKLTGWFGLESCH